MKSLYFFHLLLTILVFSCQSASVQSANENSAGKSGVNIYLINSSADLSADATALDKVPFTLEESPLIEYDQIESYTVANHTFRLNDTAINTLKGLSKNLPLAGRPFAVVVDGLTVYVGLFWNPISSFGNAYPFITLESNIGNDLIVEFRTQPPGGVIRIDPRNEKSLLARFKQDSKLR